MHNKYIENDKPIRARIVQDIIKSRLKGSDLETIMENDIIKAHLSTEPFLEKKDKSAWTREYLEDLFYPSGPKYFSREFLLYLNEVAEYVTSKEPQKRKTRFDYKYIFIGIIIFILIVFLKSCLPNTQ